MLKIICGQNTESAYQYFLEEKTRFKKLGYETIEIDLSQIEEIISWQKDNLSLFAQKKVFLTRNFNKKINKKSEKTKKILKKIIEDKELILIDWEEDLEKRDLKIDNPKIEVKEFKLPTSIFNLLDNLYPQDFDSVIKSFILLTKKNSPTLVFYMINKRVRQLLMIKFNQGIKDLPSWQLKKLTYQASFWPKEKLIKFYQSLFQLEKKIKTSTTPFDLKKSLELLFSYLLS